MKKRQYHRLHTKKKSKIKAYLTIVIMLAIITALYLIMQWLSGKQKSNNQLIINEEVFIFDQKRAESNKLTTKEPKIKEIKEIKEKLNIMPLDEASYAN